MDYLSISTEANDARWRERSYQKMQELMTVRFPCQDASSQPGLLQEELSGDAKIMSSDFYKAIDDGDVEQFVDVLKTVSDHKRLPLFAIFDQVTPAGDSLLHVAADLGREDIAELFSHYFPGLLTRRNIRGDTALHIAARSKKSNVIKVILTQYDEMKDGEKITRLTNEYGDTALHEAVYSMDDDVVAELCNADSLVVHYLNKAGRSPLYLAVVTGNVKILDRLLPTPFPAYEPPRRCFGNSPLHAAIMERNPGLLKKILDTRAELKFFKDEDGGTPLHYAAYIGYVEGIRILLNSTSHTALERNTKGYLPIHLACKKGLRDHVNVVKELLQEKWPDPKFLLNQKGQNILHVAVKNGNTRMVSYLLRNKNISRSIINQKDNSGNTPLHLASRNLFPWVLYRLMGDKRIDVNLMNSEGLTALDIVWLHRKFHSTTRELVSYIILKNAGVPLKLPYILHPPRQQWPKKGLNVKDVSNTFLLVGILMITVTFAAGFTVPGGVYSSDDPNPKNRGMAILAHRTLFKIFMAFNMVAMYSSTIGTILVMWTHLGDSHISRMVMVHGYLFFNLALLTMSVAFMAAVRLVVSNNPLLANVTTFLGAMFISLILFCRFIGCFPLGCRVPLLRQLSGFFLWFLCILFANVKKPVDHTKKGKKGERDEPINLDPLDVNSDMDESK